MASDVRIQYSRGHDGRRVYAARVTGQSIDLISEVGYFADKDYAALVVRLLNDQKELTTSE